MGYTSAVHVYVATILHSSGDVTDSKVVRPLNETVLKCFASKSEF